MIVADIDASRQRFGVEPIGRVLTSTGLAIARQHYHAAADAYPRGRAG